MKWVIRRTAGEEGGTRWFEYYEPVFGNWTITPMWMGINLETVNIIHACIGEGEVVEVES